MDGYILKAIHLATEIIFLLFRTNKENLGAKKLHALKLNNKIKLCIYWMNKAALFSYDKSWQSSIYIEVFPGTALFILIFPFLVSLCY